MQLLVTPAIEDTLSKLLETKLPSETEKALHQCLTQKTIPLCVAKQLSEMTGTLLQDLLKGSKIVPPIPPEKPNTLDPQRLARKEKLKKVAEDRAYFSMVKDIAVGNPLALQKEKVEMRTALKDAAIPLNIVLTSAGAFAFGYYFVNWMTNSFAKATTAGTILATGVFLVEVTLFIIRQQKEQRRFESDDHGSNQLLPFGLPGTDLKRKDKKD